MPVNSKQNHRLNPFINNFPENYNPFWQQKTVSQNKYSDVVRNGKKTFKVGTSWVKGTMMKEANKQLDNSFAELRSFPQAILKHLNYYVVPSLTDKTPTRFFCMEDVMMSVTKILLQKRLQMK